MISKPLLPVNDVSMQNPNFFQLLRQGAMLHYATLNGSLRISKAFRERHGDTWKKVAFDRFVKECGMNVALFFALVALSWMYFPENFGAAVALSVFVPPLLSATQVAVDYIRPDGSAYFDPKTKAGMSVKLRNLPDGSKGWQFYNHFAFPVGYNRGHDIRHGIHHQAQDRFVHLSCIPQNVDIENYYNREHPNSTREKSLMVWDYRFDAG